MYAVPQQSEMFSDAQAATEVASRFEQYKSVLGESNARSARGDLAFVPEQGIVKGIGNAEVIASKIDTIQKGLAPDVLSGVQAELDALKAVQADMAKDWSLSFPNSNGLVPFDLEAPAKLLVPRATPLRNSLPRSRGVGTARQFRRILGWTNSRSGGVADAMAFFSSETTTNTFGGVTGLRRPNKITYASDSKSVTYVEQGLSDSVTWKAQFAGQGYQDIRSLSQTALLWATFGAEERGLLYGRGGSGNGYAGAVSAPSGVTAVGAATGGSIGAGTYSVKVTALAGGGESVVSNEATTAALTGSTNQITVTVGTEPTGALGYNLYVGTSSGTETFQGSFAGNSYVLTSYATGGAAMPGADSTSNAAGYDGFLTVLSDPTQAGYFKRANAQIFNSASPSSSLGDSPFQDAFVALYGANAGSGSDKRLADPEEIWCDGNLRRHLGDFLKLTAASSAYRIGLTEEGGHTIGSVVNGISNQVTGRMVDLNVHPYMPNGCAWLRSKTLPVPDSEVSNTSEVINVQDYMSVEWPVMQMTYDQSTYMFGTLVHYAPAWSGLIVGLS